MRIELICLFWFNVWSKWNLLRRIASIAPIHALLISLKKHMSTQWLYTSYQSLDRYNRLVFVFSRQPNAFKVEGLRHKTWFHIVAYRAFWTIKTLYQPPSYCQDLNSRVWKSTTATHLKLFCKNAWCAHLMLSMFALFEASSLDIPGWPGIQ